MEPTQGHTASKWQDMGLDTCSWEPIVFSFMWQLLGQPRRYRDDSLVVSEPAVGHMSMNKASAFNTSASDTSARCQLCANLIWFLHNQRNWTLLFPPCGYRNGLQDQMQLSSRTRNST